MLQEAESPACATRETVPLRVQKRCARIILDASYSDNSVELFSDLGWLPIDDVI